MNSLLPPDTLEKNANRQLWWQLGILVAVSAIAVYASSAFDEQIQGYLPEQRSISSTFNKKPSGLSGLAEVLRKVGLSAHPWLLPYRNLHNEHGTLVIIAPQQSPAEFEAEQILAWVEAGNSLVYLDHFSFKMTRKLLEKIDVTVSDNADVHDEKIPVDATNSLFAHVPKLTLTTDTMVSGGTPLVLVDKKPVFSELHYGKGKILVGTAPNICANRELGDKSSWSNFQFLVNWLSTVHGDIMFDERCHGFSQSKNVFVVLASSPWGAVLAQVFLILAVAICSASQRFGALKQVNESRKISNLEFITGLSNAYLRAKANNAIFEITALNLRNKICKMLSISPHEDTAKIAEAWTQWAESNPTRMVGLKDIVPKFLNDFDQALRHENVNDAQFKSMIADCDKISESMNQEHNTSLRKII
ncbi:MAG TPA: DUF4350 domain-containing protein [Drouetiella sp.]